jgi:hypothetical protein
MATKSNSTENGVVQGEFSEEATVPAQHGAPKLEVVELVDETSESFAEKVKGVFRNKKVIAGASSVLLIAVGVFVAKKRMNADEVEDATPES